MAKDPVDPVLKEREKRISELFRLAEKKGVKLKRASELQSFVRMKSGLPQMDELGGPILGRFIVIYGAEGTGKTTMALQWISCAQKDYPDKVVLLVEPERKLDHEWAELQGVDMEALLIVQDAQTLEDFCNATRDLISTGAISLCIVDSVSAMTPQAYLKESKQETAMEKSHVAREAIKIQQFLKLTSFEFFKHDTACVLIGQIRTHGIGTGFEHDGLSGGHMQKHMALQIWQFSRLMGRDDTEKVVIDIDGKKVTITKSFKIKAQLEKDTGPNMSKAAIMKFNLGVGFDMWNSWFNSAIRYKVLEQVSAAWYQWTDTSGQVQKIQGRDKAIQYFEENEVEKASLMDKVVKAYSEKKVHNTIEESGEEIEGEEEAD